MTNKQIRTALGALSTMVYGVQDTEDPYENVSTLKAELTHMLGYLDDLEYELEEQMDYSFGSTRWSDESMDSYSQSQYMEDLLIAEQATKDFYRKAA
jgi:hypothetical protein